MNSSKKKPKHHELHHDVWTWVATIGRVGFARKAPGTFGSLVALPLAFGVRWGFEQAGLVSSVTSNLAMTRLGLSIFLILFIIATVFGWFAIAHTEKKWDLHDASCIVVDEVLAQLAVLIWWPFSWTLYAAGFGLFRLFDIWKPWPVRTIDQRLHGAWGTLLDDYAAGIYAVAILVLMKMYLPV